MAFHVSAPPPPPPYNESDKAEIKAEVRDEVRQELRWEVEKEVRRDLKKEITGQVHRNVRREMASALPTRSNTVATNTTTTSTSGSGYISDDGPDGDPSSATGLLQERCQALKHMCGYLEAYISEVAKIEKSQAKDQDKILKTLSHPLKEGHHFDNALGGISGLFENLRANTQARANLHTETSKNCQGTVLPILERLHQEIKAKTKEISGGAGKGAKAVDAARQSAQRHIESLSSHVATFDSAGGRVPANHDPYVLQRGIYHRLNKQVLEENNNRQDIIAVQNNFSQFEAHVITTVQSALNSFNQFMSGQADRQKAMFGDIAATASNVPLDFEWNGFLKRYGDTLVNPHAPPRTMDGITFPNQDHRATKPLIEGSLERKHRGGIGAITGYKSGYYAVTAAGYLHQFADNDNYKKDPTPDVSLYLPDCVIGAVDGQKFTIKGKDSSGSKIGQKMAISSDFQFKAHTADDAQKWHHIIAEQCSGQTASVPTSPAEGENISPIGTKTEESAGQQEAGVVGGEKESVPTSATSPSPVQPSAVSPQSTTVTSPGDVTSPAVESPGEQQSTGITRSVSGASNVTEGKHYHGAPGENKLGEREYVSKQ